MLKAVLFDLDDTLLGNDMDRFLPGYFALLGQHAERYLPRDRFLQELMTCTEAMIRDVDPSLSNRDVFWQHFARRTGLDVDELEAFFEQFYRHQFHQLRDRTEKRPFAAELVQFCLDQNLEVVVATNPLFPLIAIEARLAWGQAAACLLQRNPGQNRLCPRRSTHGGQRLASRHFACPQRGPTNLLVVAGRSPAAC